MVRAQKIEEQYKVNGIKSRISPSAKRGQEGKKI